MAPRARRAVLPLMILLLQLSVLGDVSAKKDPLRSRRVEEGPFGDLLKVDEDADEGGRGDGGVRNHALKHRKVSVKFKDDVDEEEEEEEEVCF